ncbi:hypothetical protein EJ02DRAFT_321962, partial [Clathrospora elynae]
VVLRKQYVLGDFAKYAAEKFANQFAAIADLGIYDFADKSYMDDNQKTQRVHMLLIGHYHRTSGGPSVWAHATGTYIRYYSGAGIEVTPLVQDIHTSRVYYDPPFSLMGGAQNSSNTGRGMNDDRKRERAVVESAINVIFLMTGRLMRTMDLENPDLLRNFRTACKNFDRHLRMNTAADRALHE